MMHIGIDPGTHTGFAISKNGKLIEVCTLSIHEAMDRVRDLHAKGPITVHFEDARLRRWFGKMDAQQAKYGAAVREGAGAAKRDAAIWADFLAYLGCPYRNVKPSAGSTKNSAEQFARITGWTARTNEHGRDAALLVYGR